MALMTYILLSGAVAGSKGRFDPELLSIAASQGITDLQVNKSND
jgi:hypothetical protein